MSARDQAESLLHDAEQLDNRPELQAARASVAQGYALLALADTVERAAADMVAAVVNGETPVEGRWNT